ncbi:MAG: cytochrome c biogenesis protein CcsA [Deltaproteobacteria bacterium]|nr:cytochrome c biogenesis protein CcsA [Deltaproteobacteria bacterium]
MLWATWIAYGLTALLALLGHGWTRRALGLAVALHLATATIRGVAIEYIPLTSKAETFLATALALAVVLLVHFDRARRYTLPMLLAIGAALYTSARFDHGLGYPVPPLITIWYPLHVPLSFLSYGAWMASAAAGFAFLLGAEDPWIRKMDRLALQGFGLWSVSMIFGGIWGVVAWGAYFLWDPKVIWSVILWLHYASYVHLKLTPSLVPRTRLRAALAVLGAIWVIVAFIGTSFFFGSSSHAFSG